MSDKQPEALRLADAFGIPHWTGLPVALHVEAAAELRRLHEENEALRARLAQPEQAPTNNGRYLTGYKAQPEPKVYSDVDEMFRDMGVPVTEPVATVYDAYDTTGIDWHCKDAPATGTKLYTAPPQREWQGLTDEEITETLKAFGLGERAALARAIEAKLREKNT